MASPSVAPQRFSLVYTRRPPRLPAPGAPDNGSHVDPEYAADLSVWDQNQDAAILQPSTWCANSVLTCESGFPYTPSHPERVPII